MGKRILAVMAMFLLPAILACGTAAPEVVEREVIKEVPVEKIVEKEKLVEVIKTIEKLVVATPTAAPPPGAVEGPSGSVISATSDMAEMGMDPSISNSSNVKTFTDEMYLYAIMQAPDGQLIGGAATKWAIDPNDPLRWIYTVREGVKFHNGSPMTAEDMNWTWNRNYFDPASEVNATWGPKMQSITQEGNTVVVTTKEPQPLMPLWWPSYEGGQTGAVLPKNTSVDQIRNNPVSAGNFKFVERSRGEFVKLEAFEDHYCCVPGFETLTILEVPEIATRLALLKTGGADLIEAVPSLKPDLEKAGLKTYSGQGATSSSMWFNHAHIPQSPFYDKRVREAISIAIDRQTIVDRLYAGEGGPTTSFFSGPGSFGFAADLEPYPYDPERAKQLMQEAGYGDGFKVRVVTYLYDADFPDMPTLSQAVLGYLEELGIQGTVQVMEWTAMKEEMTFQQQAACGEAGTGPNKGWCPDNPANPEVAAQEPFTIFLRGNDTRFHALKQNRGYMHPDGRRPVIQYQGVVDAMDTAAGEFDWETHRGLFEDYNRLVHQEYIQGLLIYANALFAASDKIGDWQPITGRTYPNNQWTLKPAK